MAKEQYFAHPPRGHVALLAYDDVNNRWQVLDCTADGYLKTRLQEVNGTVLIQQYMPSLLQPGVNAYIAGDWQKQPLMWGFSDTYAQAIVKLDMPAGSSNVVGATVGDGEVWRVTGATCMQVGASCTGIRLYCHASGQELIIDQATTFGSGVVTPFKCDVIMKKDDYMYFKFYSMTLNDDAHVGFWGYKMNVDM